MSDSEFVALTLVAAGWRREDTERHLRRIRAEAVKEWQPLALIATAMIHNGEKHGRPEGFPTCEQFICREYALLAKSSEGEAPISD